MQSPNNGQKDDTKNNKNWVKSDDTNPIRNEDVEKKEDPKTPQNGDKVESKQKVEKHPLTIIYYD